MVITGAAIVSSLGLSAQETWAAILSGRCGIHRMDAFDMQGFQCNASAQAQGIDPSELCIHPRDSRIMDKHSYMLMKAARDAYAHSRLDTRPVSPEETGFFAGMGMVDYNIEDILPAVLSSLDSEGNLDYDKFFSDTFQQIHPLWPLSMLNNISFCQVAIDLGIKGENTVFSPHADSCTYSIIEAFNSVREKKSRVTLAGGVSEKISPSSLARAFLFGILNNEEPACRPFGMDRKGTILGEGCGILALESESSARERGVTALAMISGYGASFGISEASNCPTAKAISSSMEDALKRASLSPADIDLVIAHGDGTYSGDKKESEAIHRTFEGCIKKINLFSSKGALGHLLGGAAAVDAAIGVHILASGFIPAICNSLPIDNGIKFNIVSGEPLKADPRRILINSTSYEGQCASLIIESVD